jgi:hypothetical protein
LHSTPLQQLWICVLQSSIVASTTTKETQETQIQEKYVTFNIQQQITKFL